MSTGPQHQGTSLYPTGAPKTITSPLVTSVPWTAPSAVVVTAQASGVQGSRGDTGGNPQGDRLTAFYA